MITYLGDFPTGSTIYVPFHTFSSDDPSASMTITDLAVTDIEIYKNGSTTQRASDAGYTLLDTDGIDFDGITGLHGFSIDTSDNTDAGFYAAGNDYWVAVSSITLDGATVNFWAAIFSIDNRGLLRPTTAQRTVDVTTGGAVGIDWGNIENPTTVVDLAGTDINKCDTVTTLTGHTPQTGDSYARLGAPAGASVSADIATVDGNVDTLVTRVPAEVAQKAHLVNGTGDITPPTDKGIWDALGDGTKSISDLNDVSTAEINAEVDTALSDINLDHLVKTAVDTDFPTTVALDSVIGHMVDTGTTATFDRTTDSNEGIRNSTALATVCTEARLSELDEATAGKMANQVDEIRTDTEDIQTQVGTAGAGLTSIPWNAAWDAEVQSEVEDAFSNTGDLSGISLDDMIDRIYCRLNHKVIVVDSTGAIAVRNSSDTSDIATGSITDDDTNTTQSALSW